MGNRRDALAARREEMGYTQESFGAAVGVEFSTVGRWERGNLTPLPYRRQRIAKVLDVSLDELSALLAPTRQALTVVAVPPDPAEADDMNRRDLLRLFSMTGAALALPAGETIFGDVDRLPAAARTDVVDVAGVEEFAQVNANLWRVYALSPVKSQTLPFVQAQLNVLTGALRRPRTALIQRRLCELTADLYQLAGEIFFDGDRYTDAAHCYALAASAGKEASASDLWACALTRHAFLSVYERQFDEARPMLDMAAAIARGGDPGLSTRHWVAVVQAETFAGLGDLDSCQRALDTAAQVQHLPGPVHNGGWLRFDGSRLAEERGTCYGTLGRHDLAETALIDALHGTLTGRRKAGVQTDLAMIGVHRRDPDQVVAYADAVLDAARQTGSKVIARKLRVLRPHLAPLLKNQQIQRLDAEITDLVGDRAA
jgi:transcriptional regulator with XRE-family HTH domain